MRTAIRNGVTEASRIFGHLGATIYRWMKELHEEIKVLEKETHVEVDEIWHKRKSVIHFAIGRKTKLILNYHVGDRDYRDVNKSELRKRKELREKVLKSITSKDSSLPSDAGSSL